MRALCVSRFASNPFKTSTPLTRAAGLLSTLLISAAAALPCAAWAAPAPAILLEKPQIFPRELYVKESSPVVFSAKVIGVTPEAIPAETKIGLIEVTVTGKKVRYLGPMMDDGILGDSIKKDGVYSRKVQINEKKQTTLYFAAVDETSGIPEQVAPEQIAPLTFVRRPSFIELLGQIWDKIFKRSSTPSAP